MPRKSRASNLLCKYLLVTAIAVLGTVLLITLISGTKTHSKTNVKYIPTISPEDLRRRKTITSREDKNITKIWKTYTDTYHKYSFKYPTTWRLKVNSAKNGTNVYLSDENNIKRISFIGIPDTQVCDPNEAKKEHTYEGANFAIGNVLEGSGNGCGKDKYPVDLPDVRGQNITLFFEFVQSPAEPTAREILKTVDNLKERILTL